MKRDMRHFEVTFSTPETTAKWRANKTVHALAENAGVAYALVMAEFPVATIHNIQHRGLITLVQDAKGAECSAGRNDNAEAK